MTRHDLTPLTRRTMPLWGSEQLSPMGTCCRSPTCINAVSQAYRAPQRAQPRPHRVQARPRPPWYARMSIQFSGRAAASSALASGSRRITTALRGITGAKSGGTAQSRAASAQPQRPAPPQRPVRNARMEFRPLHAKEVYVALASGSRRTSTAPIRILVSRSGRRARCLAACALPPPHRSRSHRPYRLRPARRSHRLYRLPPALRSHRLYRLRPARPRVRTEFHLTRVTAEYVALASFSRKICTATIRILARRSGSRARCLAASAPPPRPWLRPQQMGQFLSSLQALRSHRRPPLVRTRLALRAGRAMASRARALKSGTTAPATPIGGASRSRPHALSLAALALQRHQGQC
mmetsp:Transcript_75304/g.161330  ORF Transcript_75304/g.161330 Transcript_75304/m.161330 type:complete len:351 (-) Transcript_75304:381-1433(-)